MDVVPDVAVVHDNSSSQKFTQGGSLSSPDGLATIRYSQYENAQAIDYIPEVLIAEGIRMLKSLEEGLKTLTIGNKLREEVWQREIAR